MKPPMRSCASRFVSVLLAMVFSSGLALE